MVIPPKRNKFGKRFGFTRFSEVEDGRILAVKLENILIDNVKIHAKIPRFSRGQSNRKEETKRRGVNQNYNDGNATGKKSSGHPNSKVGARSFAKVVNVAGASSTTYIPRKTPVHISYNLEEDDIFRLNKAYVRVVNSPDMSYNIQTSFKTKGYFSIKVTPLGANLCLLEESEEGEIRDLIREAKSWWKQWFSNIRRWR
ncbi:unnamed protein product [Lathyrus sativus]|nr:unnamed protein product [Lathyrus sativus]